MKTTPTTKREQMLANAFRESAYEREKILKAARPEIQIFLEKCREGLGKSSPEEIAAFRLTWGNVFKKSPHGDKILNEICERMGKGMVFSETEIAGLSKSLEDLAAKVHCYLKELRELQGLQEQTLSLRQQQSQLLDLQRRMLTEVVETQKLEAKVNQFRRVIAQAERVIRILDGNMESSSVDDGRADREQFRGVAA